MPSAPGNYFAALPAHVPHDVIDFVRADAPPDLRWMHPEDLHLTLAFFGHENPERHPAVGEVLARIPFTGAEVTLGPLLALPKAQRCTALAFALADGRDELAELIATWRGPLLEAAGCAPDDRPPLPHLTVARPPREHTRAGKEKLLKWAEQLRSPATSLRILPPALYGWSHQRHHRSFRVIEFE